MVGIMQINMSALSKYIDKDQNANLNTYSFLVVVIRLYFAKLHYNNSSKHFMSHTLMKNKR